MASELGISFEGVSSMPRTEALQLDDVRIGLWDQYGGSMPSGWTRWLFEQFEFPFEVVYPPGLDQGNLKQFRRRKRWLTTTRTPRRTSIQRPYRRNTATASVV
jgi:hypothetical protein